MRLFTLLMMTVLSAQVAAEEELITKAVNGQYYFATPERGATSAQIEFGQLGNKTVLAVAKGPGMPPAVYTYLPEQSATLERAVFQVVTLYVFQYDSETFVIAQGDGVLGRAIWNNIGYLNVYSKDKAKLTTLPLDQARTWALQQSAAIMQQEVGAMAHASGTYHLAVPMDFAGKRRATWDITMVSEPEKQLIIKPDPDAERIYTFLNDESAAVGVDVYRNGTSDYLFDQGDGVFLYTFSNAGGFGRVEWGDSSHYNVLANNQAYVRQLLVSKEQQQKIDELMATYFATAKEASEARAAAAAAMATEDRRLPARGMNDADLDAAAFEAIKTYVSTRKWDETLQGAYITSSDWAIVRNPLSGIITGRNLRAVVTMTHPDGRSRFQHVLLRQQHDGTSYVNLHMVGVGPIYDILPEHMVIP
jgi:hypothetical protein